MCLGSFLTSLSKRDISLNAYLCCLSVLPMKDFRHPLPKLYDLGIRTQSSATCILWQTGLSEDGRSGQISPGRETTLFESLDCAWTVCLQLHSSGQECDRLTEQFDCHCITIYLVSYLPPCLCKRQLLRCSRQLK